MPLDAHDVIFANPPFSGRIDRDRIVDDVTIGASTATELLFVKYMIDNLKPGAAPRSGETGQECARCPLSLASSQADKSGRLAGSAWD